jgi:sigma-B regulation protein RsbU (phosphoserine phosphatase)
MNTHVAVYAKDPKVFEALKLSAEASSFILHEAPHLSEYKDHSFVICDVETFLEMKLELALIKKFYLYVISSGTDEENMKLIETHELQHLVGMNEGIYAQEIICHIRRSFNKKLWGLTNHLAEGSEIKVISLSDSKFTNEMIKEALGHFDFQDYFSSPIEYLQVMANELISNSLYKGPNKKRQEQGLDSADRKSPVFLKGSDLVQVTLGMDPKGIALSVQDSFGGLSYELLIASLKRSFEEKTVMEKKDGAGLGLYLTFLHSNQFIINYRKDFRTEVICIIEQNKRYKNYKQRIRSFHFFQEVPSEKTNHK